jgi:peptide/nickel transport system permease protein
MDRVMLRYLIRRLVALVPTFLLASVIVFSAIRLIPGDTIDMMMSQNDISASVKTREDLIKALGLDQPVLVQYWHWISSIVLHGDFGRSLWTGESVTSLVAERIPTTLYLGVLAMIFALLIALPVGIISAIRQNKPVDYLGRVFAITALSVPPFWLGTLVVILPAMLWGIAPTTQYVGLTDDPLLSLRQMVPPAIVLGIALSGVTMRMTRTMVLEVMRQDYVRTAWSKGLDERTVVLRHVLKNALLPVITIVGLQLPLLIGGAVVIEQIFVISGMGQLLLMAVSQRDYPVITGIFLLVGVGVMTINLLVDISYALLDPKIRQG